MAVDGRRSCEGARRCQAFSCNNGLRGRNQEVNARALPSSSSSLLSSLELSDKQVYEP